MTALAVNCAEDLSAKESGKILGTLIKSRSGVFTVLSGEDEYECVARGNLKIKDVKLLTGDHVEFSDGVITSIAPRSNELSRPHVVNVDCINIVIASLPKPDFLLVDKIIAEGRRANVDVYLTVNKCDEDQKLAEYCVEVYKNAVENVFTVSAKSGEGVDELKQTITGKICCFVGQSAVGKTSLCNSLFGIAERVSEISEKTKRGRHTTTSRKIHYAKDLFVVDTPGFSAFDSIIESKDLALYYKDFATYHGKCYYVGCSHTAEPDCLVKEAVERGEIHKDRHERYCLFYKEIKEYEKRKY